MLTLNSYCSRHRLHTLCHLCSIFQSQAESIHNISNPEVQIVQNGIVIEQLVRATEPRAHSLLPNDLQISTRVLSTVIGILEDNKKATNEVM